MRKWQQRLNVWLEARSRDLSSICLRGIQSPSLHLIYYPLGFWVNIHRRRSSKPLIPLSLPLVLVVRLETLWTRTPTSLYSQTWGYKAIRKLLEDGTPTRAETTLLSVLEALLQVKARIYLLSMTRTPSKKLP